MMFEYRVKVVTKSRMYKDIAFDSLWDFKATNIDSICLVEYFIVSLFLTFNVYVYSNYNLPSVGIVVSW